MGVPSAARTHPYRDRQGAGPTRRPFTVTTRSLTVAVPTREGFPIGATDA